MICIIAGDYQEALTWAKGQFLHPDEWFYPSDIDDLLHRTDFHVVVIGTAGQNVPPSYFNKIFRTAKERGRLKR